VLNVAIDSFTLSLCFLIKENLARISLTYLSCFVSSWSLWLWSRVCKD